MRHLSAWAGNNVRLLIVVCFALGAIMFTLTWLGVGNPATASVENQLQEPIDGLADADGASAPQATDTPAAPGTVIVYVSGAVSAPDVYELPLDARIKDLVLAAGGLTADADPERINLAERLNDSEHIHVPRLGEAPSDTSAAADTGSATPDALLNLNTASASDLDSLPGIGQSFAERIIEYRTANGPFT